MATRWFDSSKPGRGGSDKLPWLRAALALALLAASVPAPARADDPLVPVEPSPSPSVAAMDPGFLLLPAHDVERLPAKAAPGQQTQAAASKPVVGDSFELRVLGADPSLKVDDPPGGESLTDQGWEVEAGTEGRFTATALKPGTLTLPSLALKDASGKIVARTNPVTFDVDSAIKKDDPKPEEPVETRPPVALHFPWWVLVAGGLFIAVAAIAAFHFGRRYLASRKPKEAPRPVEPPKPEDVVALEALASLDKLGYVRRSEFKPYYFGISEAIKNYVGARFGFDAPECTTREMITALEEGKLVSDQWIDRLESLFERLDRVKFTDHVPEIGEPARLMEEAKQFILTTRRAPPVAPDAPGASGGSPAQEVQVAP